MPTSNAEHLGHLHTKVMNMQPKRILDVGMGFGSKGVVFRELTDIRHLRYLPEEWSTKIDGIEIFEKYITPVHRYIYNDILIGDARNILKDVPDNSYDFVYMGDVIEHFEKEEGIDVIKQLKRISKSVYICTPNIFIPQGDAYGNENERHLSFWSEDHFRGWEINHFGILMTCFLQQ